MRIIKFFLCNQKHINSLELVSFQTICDLLEMDCNMCWKAWAGYHRTLAAINMQAIILVMGSQHKIFYHFLKYIFCLYTSIDQELSFKREEQDVNQKFFLFLYLVWFTLYTNNDTVNSRQSLPVLDNVPLPLHQLVRDLLFVTVLDLGNLCDLFQS